MDTMEFVKIDSIYPFQLEVGDFIRVDNKIVLIDEIAELENAYAIFYLDEFDEKEFIEVSESKLIDIYLPD